VPQHRKAFFAFPAEPPDLRATIESAAKIVESSLIVSVKLWAAESVFGAIIPDEVRDRIREVDVVVCDVTRQNLNVYYEAGFAIGAGKALAPVVNASFAGSAETIGRDGIFDSVGYGKYENAAELGEWLAKLPDTKLMELYGKPLNHQQPLFFLDAFRKTDFRNAIVSTIKDSKVFFRSFDPAEIPRLQTVAAIADVSSSSGVVIPFLSDHIDDSVRHNLRGAFLAGIAHGYGRETLLVQRASSDAAQPADFRDMVIAVRSENDVDDKVRPFAVAALQATQSIQKERPRPNKSALQRLTLGARAAENEFRTLEEYFVETAEFLRTLRGEARVVAGRKGSGKTAIFFMVRDRLRRQRNSIIIDLKPESHQLSLFREELLKLVDIGVFDHTLAAFWHFVILTEIALAIGRDADFRSRRYDPKAFAIADEVEAVLRKYQIGSTGDFTSRITRLGSQIVDEIQRLTRAGQKPSADRLTNIIFKGAVADLRALITRATLDDTRIVLLFDNIDKGWPANGVHRFDARLVRLLIEGVERLRNDLGVQGRDFVPIVFLRNDIYELLLDETPDRGKTAEIRIDWTDRIKLRQVIFRRLKASTDTNDDAFEPLWSRFFVAKIGIQDTIDYFIDHCLMRPRFLINIVENAIANGINRGHQSVTLEDCEDAVRQHANYLMDDFGYEIRDVSGISADILYALRGLKKLATRLELLARFRKEGIVEAERAFDLMLWYGLIGVAEDGGDRYVYHYEYNLKRLQAGLNRDETLYAINPAISAALADP
jgi:hypothetical protein